MLVYNNPLYSEAEVSASNVRFGSKGDIIPGAQKSPLLAISGHWPGPFAVAASRPYSGNVTLNSMAASCSGDLPMLSRNGSQRGSDRMLANKDWTAIEARPGSL